MMSENQTNTETTDVQSQRIVAELTAARKKRMEIEQSWDNVRIAQENREAQKKPDIHDIPLILRPALSDNSKYNGEELPFCVLYPDLGERNGENPHLKSPSEERYTATIGRPIARFIRRNSHIGKTSENDHTRD